MMLNGSILLGFDGSILDFDTALKREDDENHHHHHHVQNLIEEEVDEVEEEENIGKHTYFLRELLCAVL